MEFYTAPKKVGLISGPFICVLLFVLPVEIISTEADKVLSVALWMLIWWITEAVSITVTALLPLVLFPIFGVLAIKEVSQNYGHPIVFLFFGGFILALALEKVNLHRRIAINIVKITGTSANSIILGFMIATGFLSMWISNTACTVMMLPIALSVVKLLIVNEHGFTKGEQNFALSLMLGIAFSANVGGVATVIGTPPNSVLIAFLESTYQIEVSFVQWMLMALPFSVVMIGIIYFILVHWIYPNNIKEFTGGSQVIAQELSKLGAVSKQEFQVLIIFIIVVFLWIFRTFINQLFPGLALSDTVISMIGAIAFFTIPFKLSAGKFTLTWKDAEQIPWGILLLFGGGLALAQGLASVGIIELVANSITSYQNLSLWLIAALLIFSMLFMTELMSNVALVTIFIPVIAGIALGLDISMLHLLIPVTIAASCAFMLPMATPPNAIVFASGFVKISQMARVGIILNILSILLLILFFKFYVGLFFN